MTKASFPIIAIGASAGGIDAFHSFFDHMPPDCGMAFVMILHLPPHRTSMLTEILARWTSLRVLEGVDGTQLEPNCVYVPPPHSMVSVVAGHIRIDLPIEDTSGLFRPIDGFFDSLATEMGERSVGIVLSGTGSDGALGLKAIKECGGITLAQGSDGTVPQYGQMPAGAIATGAVDLVVPVEDMPSHLLRLIGNPQSAAKEVPNETKKSEIARLRICAILRSRLGHDFSGYRSQTFLRRIDRRMHMVNVDRLEDYADRLASDPDEVSSLFRDLLIRVTSFFRDKETFEKLEKDVIPRLFEGKDADSTVRIWVAGCATGEEAYSLAILLREYMDGLQGVPRVQIFATDIDDSAISIARLGRYPTTLLHGLSDARRARFFELSQNSYIVKKEIRDLCTFSPHNLVRDPPFSRMDLVSCRNLLIYMNTELQTKVIPVFHHALVKDGMLLLGGSESVSQHSDLFETVDKAARIFQRKNVPSPSLQLTLLQTALLEKAQSGTLRAAKQPNSAAGSPPSDGVSDSYLGINLRRRRGDYGNTSSDDVEELLAPLPATAQVVEKLQMALRVGAEQLRSLEEQHQTALEELRSANEEMHSVNEEMQSTNEELETSKEELQSLNEELQTVNFRLSDKNDELDQKNSDLRNLFDSTEIATVFLDRFLIIRSFTPAVISLYNLIPSDVGRPLTDISSRLDYRSLPEDVRHVLQALEPLERRIKRRDGPTHYIMRILPYREPDSTVSGVLVTFVDVSSIVKAEAALVEADVAKDVFLATLSHELRNPLAPIRTAAHLLESPGLTSVQLERSQAIIARQVRHMSSLLDDLLDVSRITRGAFLLKKEYVDLRVLLDAAIEASQPALDAKRHTFRLEPMSSKLVVEVDAVRVTQIVNNLLTNAIKYTPPNGIITAGVRVDSNRLMIFVRDNGLGIPRDLQSKVFEMFTQIDSDVKRSDGGLGIGLSLSRGLAQLHGGSLEVESEGPGAGSEFQLLLPRSLIVEATAEESAQAALPAAAPLVRRILIADDNLDGAETMGMLLESDGHEIHLAHTGTHALDAAKQLKPDIVILDIGMPDLDGYEVAKRIRHEAWGENMLLIAITGWGQAEDKRRAHAAGFDHHLTKPVDPKQLEQLFR